MKKAIFTLGMAAVLTLGACTLAACGGTSPEAITKAVGREAASGTRSAFEENVESREGVLIQDALKERPYAGCVSESNSTAAVIAQVAQRFDTLGYISLGSLAPNADRVQAVKLNGVEATAENVVNGSYPISRPFNLIYKESVYEENDLVRNFISFIESAAGQEILEEEGTVLIEGLEIKEYTPYSGTRTKLTIDGSTSVRPAMLKLAAAYEKANDGVSVEVEGGGSGVGITDAQAGTADVGMASRDLKESETGVVSRKIADDGIAIIVKKGSKLKEVTFADLYALYIEGKPIAISE